MSISNANFENYSTRSVQALSDITNRNVADNLNTITESNVEHHLNDISICRYCLNIILIFCII